MHNKKKLLIGGLSTAAVVAGVAMTGGTSAYYFDAETATGNRLEACDFDLVRQSTTIEQKKYAEGDSSQAIASANSTADADGNGNTAVTLDGLQPGDAFDVTINLENVGDCEGELWADIDYPITDSENGVLEPELADADSPEDQNLINPTGPESEAGGGELDTFMQATYTDTLGNQVGPVSYHELAYRWPDMLSGAFGHNDTDTVTVHLEVPDTGAPGYGNKIMSDSFTFDVHFVLAQKNKIQDHTDIVS